MTLHQDFDLSVYRIVQMALTNALKHAGHTRAAYLPDRLMLDITNQPGTAVRNRVGGGAALFGGSLKAGPQPTGGYHVLAAIPLSAPEKA